MEYHTELRKEQSTHINLINGKVDSRSQEERINYLANEIWDNNFVPLL